MIISKRKISATTALGTFTEIVHHGVNGIIKQIFLNPATASTTYDVYLKDEDENIIFERTDAKGRLNELVDIPVTASMTLLVENASADEVFTCMVASHTT